MVKDLQETKKSIQTPWCQNHNLNQGLKPVFQCDVFQVDHILPEHYFHEFQVNIKPDLEDLFDKTEGMPGLLDIEESEDDDSELEEDWEKEWYSDTEEGSLEAQCAQPETTNTSGRATSGTVASEGEQLGKEHEAPLQPVARMHWKISSSC